jgi:hypothetical protein
MNLAVVVMVCHSGFGFAHHPQHRWPTGPQKAHNQDGR